MKPDTAARKFTLQQWIFALLLFLFAYWAFRTPGKSVLLAETLGWLLILGALVVFIQGFQRANEVDRRSAKYMAFTTLVVGALLVNARLFQSSAIFWITVFLFSWDGISQLTLVRKSKAAGKSPLRFVLGATGNFLLVAGMLFFHNQSLEWLIAIFVALRLVGMGLDVLSAKPGKPLDAADDVWHAKGLPDTEAMRDVTRRIGQEESNRAAIDRHWIIVFLIVLFGIHLGRMGFDRSSSGILSPAVALIGDMVIALIITYLIIVPLQGIFRGITKPIENWMWRWVLQVPAESRKWYSLRRPVQWWLEYRLRMSISLRKSGYSLPTAIRTGLKTGLPFSALLAAIIPVFGMSWYFDTENWAAGIWDSWAAARTDIWREAMVKAVDPTPSAKSFNLQPTGVNDSSDFSFVIVGDPGEGDASQLVLHNQIVKVSEQPLSKFVVISSDVVYPDGAMKDFEKNFWLPMLGVTKPVYAIPGNHDWYDACDAFAATFFTPAAAKAAMDARRDADLKLTSATKESSTKLIAEATRLKNLYQVPTQQQTAPFFQVATKDFAFITVETGVLRRIDPVQMAWLKQALEAAKGKFIFVLLGHPFYAIGEYQGSMNPDFEALHKMLKEYGATVMMAGDTHDLEYYQEPVKEGKPGRVVHHFVNGGGGAYLSIGAALKDRDKMPEKIWAHYPATQPLVDKIESHNNALKKPAWAWTRRYDGWPFSAEWLSAAFDYNVAPFFQSFIEVQVLRSSGKVVLIPYTATGRLTWGELEAAKGLKPDSAKADTPVEWSFGLK